MLARHAHEEEAERAATDAETFEATWEPVLAELAARLEIHEFDALRAVRNQLAHALAPASDEIERLRTHFAEVLDSTLREQFVRIDQIVEPWATLAVLTSSAEEALRPTTEAFQRAFEPLQKQFDRLAVDAFLPRVAALGVGDLAVLRIEHSAGSSFLSLLAAVADPAGAIELDQVTAPYFSDEPLSDAVLSEVERRRAAGDTIKVPARRVALAS